MTEKSGKKVLALGAGRISRPCVQYMLRQGHEVTLVDVSEQNVTRAIAGHPGGRPVTADAASGTDALIREYSPDVVVCMLPSAYMNKTAAVCVKEGVPMIGASYVNSELRALDAEARSRGVAILCEVGLDPGIDHMSAVAKIKSVKADGGVIDSFWSVCGALPDLASNTNPVGYKLSWAPESLIGASLRDAKIMIGGEVIDLPGGTTYQRPSFFEVPGLGWFEVYANADSLPYIGHYDIPEAKGIFRGTLRYPGWCDMVTQMQKLELFDETPRNFEGRTYASVVREAAGSPDTVPADEAIAKFLNLAPHSLPVKQLEWLGFFDETPASPALGSRRDVLTGLYDKKLRFSPGERDLIAMCHRFEVSYPASGRRETIVSTMTATGDVDGDTAIARTTGLPMGIAADLILRGAVKGRGVVIPTTEDIYVPSLAELEREGISFEESVES